MAVVCLDTQTLIWGIKREASPGQENMILKAECLIRDLYETRTDVIIPALVVAELLMPLKEEDYSGFLSQINQKFMVVPFDTSAAAHFATLWKAWRDRNPNQGGKMRQPTRAEMKTDLMIIATAISRQADCIYSEDSDIDKFAQGRIVIKTLPPIFYQGSFI
jgi:predicted nucleic acid-binding protein